MKSKKNGFTLVELLAVIVILALIMILVIPSILRVMSEARREGFYLYTRSLESKVLARYQNDIQMMGDDNSQVEACQFYDIAEDLDLSNTGDYHGYVKVTRTRKSDGTKTHTIHLGDGVNDILSAHYCVYDRLVKNKCTPDTGISIDWDRGYKTYTFTHRAKDIYDKNGELKEAYVVCATYETVGVNAQGQKYVRTVGPFCSNNSDHGSITEVQNGAWTYKMEMSIASRNHAIKALVYNDKMTKEEFYNKLYSTNEGLDRDIVGQNGEPDSYLIRDCKGEAKAVLIGGNNGEISTIITETTKDPNTNTVTVSPENPTNTNRTKVSTIDTTTSSGKETQTVYTEQRTTKTTEDRTDPQRTSRSSETVGPDKSTTKSKVTQTDQTRTTKQSGVIASTEGSHGSSKITTKEGTTRDSSKVSGVTGSSTKTSDVSGGPGVSTTLTNVTGGPGVSNVTSDVNNTNTTDPRGTSGVSGDIRTSNGTQDVSIATTTEPRYVWAETTIYEGKNEDMFLSRLEVSPYNIVEQFSPHTYYYTVVVPNNVMSVKVTAVPMNTDGTVEVTFNDSYNNEIKNLRVGNNSIDVKVFDTKTGEKLYYRINVDRLYENGDSENAHTTTTTKPGGGQEGAPDPTLDESNANLRYLIVGGNNINFDPNVTDYNVVLREGETELSLDYDTQSPLAKAYVTGNSNLSVGKTVDIKVVSGNGYYDKIYKLRINDKKVSSYFTRILVPIIGLLLLLLLLTLGYMWYKRTHTLIASRDEDESEFANNNQYVPDEASPQPIAKRN